MPFFHFKRIKTELIIGLTAVLVISSLITFGTVFFWSRSNFDTFVKGNDIETSKSIAASLVTYYRNGNTWEGLSEFVNLLDVSAPKISDHKHAEPEGLPVVITDRQGKVLYNGLYNRDTHSPEDLPDRMRTAEATPIRMEGEAVGYVFYKSMVYRNYNPRERTFLFSLAESLGLSLLIGLILTVLLSLFLSARFSRAVERLNDGVGKVAHGDLETTVEVDRYDEIGELAANFNRMADKLLQGEKARQNLLADIAHELRTPVSIIQANLEMIMEGVYQADEAKLKALHKETTLLTSLISSLRTLSDLEVGMTEMENEEIHLEGLVRESCDKMAAVFKDRNIAILQNLPGQSLVYADESRLVQVIGNILSNALKYGPSDSVLEVSSESCENGGDGHIKITFSDQGEGVPSESLDKLFDRFYRVDRSRSRDSGGRGLGLAISRSIIEMSGGSMGAYNRESGGLAVWFELPLNV